MTRIPSLFVFLTALLLFSHQPVWATPTNYTATWVEHILGKKKKTLQMTARTSSPEALKKKCLVVCKNGGMNFGKGSEKVREAIDQYIQESGLMTSVRHKAKPKKKKPLRAKKGKRPVSRRIRRRQNELSEEVREAQERARKRVAQRRKDARPKRQTSELYDALDRMLNGTGGLSKSGKGNKKKKS